MGFVRQKKRWNLLVSYRLSSLKDTATANLIFHRSQLLTLKLDPSPHFSILSKIFKNQMLEKISRLPPLSRGQERKVAVVNLSVLVKDSQLIKCVESESGHKTSSESFVTYINLLQLSDNPSIT